MRRVLGVAVVALLVACPGETPPPSSPAPSDGGRASGRFAGHMQLDPAEPRMPGTTVIIEPDLGPAVPPNSLARPTQADDHCPENITTYGSSLPQVNAIRFYRLAGFLERWETGRVEGPWIGTRRLRGWVSIQGGDAAAEPEWRTVIELHEPMCEMA